MLAGRHSLLRTVPLTIVALVAACGSPSVTTAPTPSATPTEPPGTEAVATTEPTAALAEGEPCAREPAESLGDTCPMPPGDYHSTQFAPGLSFTLEDSGWLNGANEPDTVAAVKPPGWWLTFVSGAPLGATGRLEDPATAKDAFGSMPGLTVDPRDDAEIGGAPAVVIDVSNDGTDEVILFTYPSGSGVYFLPPGSVIRIWWLAIEDVPTLVLIEAPAAELESLVGTLQPTLDSIAWG
jgi:hypothetical protein